MIISNITFINPVKEEAILCDIKITDGRITAFSEALTAIPEAGEEVIDGTGLHCAPGFCDIHSHFRDPGFTHKEDIETGARAAAMGGYTDIILMANTSPTVDNEETLSYVLNKGKETGIHIHSCAAVTKGLKGEELVDMDLLYKKGAAGFTDDGIPLMDEALLKEAMRKCNLLNLPISLHEEDKNLISENGINHGKASEHFGIEGSPREAEISLVKRDIEIAKETKAKLNIQHISAKETVDLIRKARNGGYTNIYAEATPHHFALTEDAVIEHGSYAKMNPPLREEADREAIIEGLIDGTISFIATDHAPHTKEEKEQAITKAPSGITGLETAFSLALEKLVVEKGMSLIRLVQLLSLNPRVLYNMKCPATKNNNAADLVIFSTTEKWVYDKTCSKSFNTPFRGQTMTGKIKYTICGGQVVYEDL